MAVKKLAGGAKKVKPSKPTIQRVRKSTGVKLPTQKTQPPTTIGEYSILIYGAQKIGKTSLTTHFPRGLHFMFEPSGRAFSLNQVEPATWEEFEDYITLLEVQKRKKKLKYDTFLVDTVDLLYLKCQDYHCALIGVVHPNDAKDYGKTPTLVDKTFREAIVRLSRLGGMVLITHETEKEVETRHGRQYSTIVPSAGKRCNLLVAKFCDMTANYYIDRHDKRMLRVTPSDEMEAGNRIDTIEHPRFRWKDGSPIKAIPMGDSSQEAYDNLMKAFNNKLKKPKRPKSKLKNK